MLPINILLEHTVFVCIMATIFPRNSCPLSKAKPTSVSVLMLVIFLSLVGDTVTTAHSVQLQLFYKQIRYSNKRAFMKALLKKHHCHKSQNGQSWGWQML